MLSHPDKVWATYTGLYPVRIPETSFGSFEQIIKKIPL